MLNDTQEQALAEVQRDLLRADRFIRQINQKIINQQLPLKPVRAPEIGTVYGETLRCVFNHELAEDKLRRLVNGPDNGVLKPNPQRQAAQEEVAA